MVHQSVDSHSKGRQDSAKSHRSKQTKGSRIGPILLLILVLGGSAAILLEHYGKINLVSGFGAGGRPTWTLGLWQLQDISGAEEAAAIDQLVAADVISGYPNDEFRPEQPISRAEFAALVSAAFVEQPASAAVSYRDVAADFWGRDAIAQATAAGFFTGYGNDTFHPEESITRAEAIVALVQGLDISRRPEAQTPEAYGNTEPTFPGAEAAIATAAAAGLLDSESDPPTDFNQPLTRGEAAGLIYRAQTSL